MTTSAPTETPVEKVSQDEMLKQFKTRYSNLIEENKALAGKIRENEATALKLQGAIEALEYYNPPEEGTVDNLSDSPPEKTTED